MNDKEQATHELAGYLRSHGESKAADMISDYGNKHWRNVDETHVPPSKLHRLRHQLDDLAMKHEHNSEAFQDFSKMSLAISTLIEEHSD